MVAKKTLIIILGSSYRNETTFLKGNEFERATLKGSINYKPIKRLRISVSTNLGNTKTNMLLQAHLVD